MKGATVKGVKLPDEIFDERSRLLKCQRERLQWMKETYDISYADLANQYNIAKSTAYYICNPEKATQKNAKRVREYKRYYKKEKMVASVTKSRNKAKKLAKKFKSVS